ncbi:non-heme iron oxygenase ferredoxin subunit [Ruegeria sp. 2205SS24-7]|uniref:non-heme iron oxygenase ferredoxin subunit n=1 Tax=Ruegeria discodermiae TaxID=3064389 RepID=UPI00274294B0|nr:non-heme iron oxygenase ferredoxin subunit [Ruegeria sp. 2205SS24-7]MDP5218539.1 non-heme iron oxygenase ferredoxin subunit [Ruegeria sp. 2205SS24-7]
MATKKPWRDVIEVTRLEKNWVTRVEVGSRIIALYDTPSGIYASLALCNHGGADLCDGYFDGHVIECPLHQGAFDVRDGRPVSAPATRAMRMFEARVENGMVQVRM